MWDAAFEATCNGFVDAVCDGAAPRDTRDRAWRSLLVAIGPVIEGWARRSPLLRRARLASPDDTRAVLVAVFERLAAHDFDNLRKYRAHAPAAPRDGDAIDQLAQLEKLCDEPAAEEGGDLITGTPFRAWLIVLVRFLERDHLRHRLGSGDGDKRAVGSHAERLDAVGDPTGVRPPVTDALTIAKIAADVRRFMAGFPGDMRAAIELWMDDLDFAEIAARLALPDPARARALVRAGHARLREEFRAELPTLFGG